MSVRLALGDEVSQLQSIHCVSAPKSGCCDWHPVLECPLYAEVRMAYCVIGLSPQQWQEVLHHGPSSEPTFVIVVGRRDKSKPNSHDVLFSRQFTMVTGDTSPFPWSPKYAILRF
jgi:hypothetical protein